MRVLIVLMTRVPIPGKTKTRLMSHLTGEECAGLQRAFIEDLIDLLRDDLKLPACIFFTPEDKDGILRNIVKDRLPLVLQRGETLGDRMSAAIRRGLAQGYEGVVVVGSDLPTLPAELIHEAGKLLADNDVVLGPTLDGGYYLIAAKADHPGIFQEISWGTKTVLAATLERIKALHLTPALLRPWNDIDTVADLRLLTAQLAASAAGKPPRHRHTREMMQTLQGKLPGFLSRTFNE